jgi:hypothetical protein
MWPLEYVALRSPRGCKKEKRWRLDFLFYIPFWDEQSPPINVQPASSIQATPAKVLPLTNRTIVFLRQELRNQARRMKAMLASIQRQNVLFSGCLEVLGLLVLVSERALPVPSSGSNCIQDKRYPGLERYRGPIYWHESLRLFGRRKGTEADRAQ